MKKSGFTILELLVVISVLVILIGIAIPRFKGMQDAGKIVQAKGELQTMQTAIESYYINASSTTRAYPGSVGQSHTTIGASVLATASPQIINSPPPYDPFGATATTEYLYYLSSNGKYYAISSVGANGSGNTGLSVAADGTVSGQGTNGICVTNSPSSC